jgi:hypothetical protein
MPFASRCLGAVLVAALAAIGGGMRLTAAEPDQGFSYVVKPSVTGEEARAQPDLWALGVAFKSMRMVYVPVTDPRTGTKSSELIWYLPYKIINRERPPGPEANESLPVNAEDPAPPPIFVPKATLVTEDRDGRRAVVDSIVPEALQAIADREGLDLKSSVQIAGPLPKPTPAGKDQNAEYGVFVFRGVDPRTTAFSVYLTGFSSAYKIGKDEKGRDLVLRRTIVLPYRRLADEFDQFEKEIRQRADGKWIYVPDEAVSAAR